MQTPKAPGSHKVHSSKYIIAFVAMIYSFPLYAQIAIPEGRCDTSLKHNFVSENEHKKGIGKTVLILPLDTHAVSGKGKKRYSSPDVKLFKNSTFSLPAGFPVSGSVGKMIDVRLVKKKGVQYMLYVLLLKSDTLYYKSEFYGKRSNHLISPFLILDYAQCIKEKYLNQKILCTKDTSLQSLGSYAQVQAIRGEEWTITDYAVVPPSEKGCIFCFWEPALIIENKAGQRTTINTPDYYMPVINFDFGTLGNFAEYFKIKE
jgi:hypothetical protein